MHTTNYFNTFIEIAEDCPAEFGEKPPLKGDKLSVANYQYDMVFDHPYTYNSDDVIFSIWAIRKDLPQDETERAQFFSKGQPCLRSSPLTKRYGWGIHSNSEGKIAMYGVESAEYQRLVADDSVTKVKAMRSKRKGK